MRAVAYYRVSTDKQGKSGLGLEAQRMAVRHFLKDDYPPLREFKEVESGKRDDRPQLARAIECANLHKAKLVIAKLDRLARDVHFVSGLIKAGVDFVAVDNPNANPLTIHILAAVAEDEAKRISERTKAALRAAKERGTILGGYRGYTPDPALGAAGKRQKADAVAAQYADTIQELRREGLTTAYGMAKALNERGIPSPRGGRWQAVSVERVLARL
jgi:DNA invertase Pin-like site-specific DNA recombinase